MKKLYFVVKRGRTVGTILTPSLDKDNRFVVGLSRFKKDSVRVKDESELPDWVAKGYSVRMNNPKVKTHLSPSLIAPGSIEIREE